MPQKRESSSTCHHTLSVPEKPDAPRLPERTLAFVDGMYCHASDAGGWDLHISLKLPSDLADVVYAALTKGSSVFLEIPDTRKPDFESGADALEPTPSDGSSSVRA